VVAQIEVTEESIRQMVDAETFERGELIASQVHGVSVSGTLVSATADGLRVTVCVTPTRLDGECECQTSVPCGHMVATLLTWVWATTPADDAGLLLAEFEDALADEQLDLELLDELVDDIEELLDSEPEAVRDLASSVMALLEARDDVDLVDLLERVEGLYLEARADE
jgi:hypothetical protein